MRYFIVPILFLVGCVNPAKQESNSDHKVSNIANSDSIRALHRAIESFGESVTSSKDSITKYSIGDINDTCINFLYVVYGKKQLKAKDSLTVSQCDIKLTSFNNKDSIFILGYSLFIQDSLPVIPDLIEGVMIHTFEYNKKLEKLTKAYLGQHDSYMLGDLEKMYLESTKQVKHL